MNKKPKNPEKKTEEAKGLYKTADNSLVFAVNKEDEESRELISECPECKNHNSYDLADGQETYGDKETVVNCIKCGSPYVLKYEIVAMPKAVSKL